MREHSFTPGRLVEEMRPAERLLFKCQFTGRIYAKIYRLLEFAAE